MQSDIELLREQAERVISSGALGRSRSYARLLHFLVAATVDGRVPKELEIAMEVFGKGADFDPSQDSMVRVYAHNLRQKLEHFYATDGRNEPQHLLLARGEYRVSVVTPDSGTEPATAVLAPPEAQPAEPVAVVGPPSRPRWHLAAALAVTLLAGTALGLVIASGRAPPPSAARAVASSPIWAGLLDDDTPILLVVGDYYIFGELNEDGDVGRLVRDFGISSRADLDRLSQTNPALARRYMNLDLNYLPTGSAAALVDVLRILYTSDKPVRVVAMSEMSDADLKSSHVVYVGYLSALDKLEDFVFASSSLAIGYTYDELRNTETGETYMSEAGTPEINRNYRDYAFISTFPGPGGNQLLIVAGTRDAGMMQAAHVLSDVMFVRSLERARPDVAAGQPPAFEVLYEVTGYGRTNLDAMLVHTAKLNYQEIWGGNLLHAAQ